DVYLPHDGIDGYARNNLLRDFTADPRAPSGLTQRQSIEAEVVDLSRDALALLSNQRQSFGLEELAAGKAGNLEPVLDITGRLVRTQGFQSAYDGDALFQL